MLLPDVYNIIILDQGSDTTGCTLDLDALLRVLLGATTRCISGYIISDKGSDTTACTLDLNVLLRVLLGATTGCI